jgi:hypothetical protein
MAREGVQVIAMIFIIEKDCGAVVATLGGRMRIAGSSTTGDSWHEGDAKAKIGDGQLIGGVSLIMLLR